MPPKVDLEKCTGCSGRQESHCEEACPGDLMFVRPDTGKAHCRATNECWDCMSCIKACPSNALTTRMPYQLGYFGATLRPVMGKNHITWKCTDIQGNETVYKYENRRSYMLEKMRKETR